MTNTGPTITIKEFTDQATKAHDELAELLHILNTETLPLRVANAFAEDQLPEMERVLKALARMIGR
jgi:hypothetical protein